MVAKRAPALTEGLRIIELIACSDDPVGFEQVCANVTMSRSSVSRLLSILVEGGYLLARPGKRGGYVSDVRLMSLAGRLSQESDQLKLINDQIQKLSQDSGDSTQYAVLDASGGRVIVISKYEIEGSIHLCGPGTNIGVYAHRHALGKVILAFCEATVRERLYENMQPMKRTKWTVMPGKKLDELLAEIKQTGFAFDQQESGLGVYRIAVPVFNNFGAIAGAVGCSWAGESPDTKQIEHKLSYLKVCADKLAGITKNVKNEDD